MTLSSNMNIIVLSVVNLMDEYILELNKQKIYVVDAHDDRVLSVKRSSDISEAKRFTSKKEANEWKRWIELGSINSVPGSGWGVTVRKLGTTYSI